MAGASLHYSRVESAKSLFVLRTWCQDTVWSNKRALRAATDKSSSQWKCDAKAADEHSIAAADQDGHTSPSLWLSGLVFLATLASSSQVTPSTAEIKSPDLTLILQRLEHIQHQDPAQSRPYELTREYKVFHGSNKEPTSEVMAQINFVPPDMKTYKITQARGNSRGAKMVRELLDRETESAKKGQASEVNRMNYDFVFLRQENFGDVPEYVLGTLPKRKDKNLLRGQIWVDASTFRIRRIEGVPAKSPSFWLKNIHITLQFAQLGGKWVPVTFDAIATIRLLGQYTLAGLTIRSSESLSTGPK